MKTVVKSFSSFLFSKPNNLSLCNLSWQILRPICCGKAKQSHLTGKASYLQPRLRALNLGPPSGLYHRETQRLAGPEPGGQVPPGAAFAFLPRPRARCRVCVGRHPGARAPWGRGRGEPRASPEPGSLPGRLPFDPAEAGKTGSPGTGPEAGNLTLKPAGGRGALPAASEALEAAPAECPQRGPLVTLTFLCRGFPLGTFPACPRGGLLRPKDGVLSVLYYLPRSATPHLHPASATSSAIVLLLVSRALFFPQRPVFAVRAGS